MRTPTPPWRDLPADLSVSLRPHLAAVVADVIAALPREVPSYGRPLEGAFGKGVQVGVEVALGRFLDLPGTSAPALGGQDRTVYLNLGRGEMRQGRELETLLAAYRVGARVAFRRFATLARAAELDADLLVPLAESVFAYIDELSAASAEGYAQEQSLRAGEIDRRRSKLAAMLLAGALDPADAAEHAAQLGWVLPDSVVVVVVASDLGEGLAVRLGREALVTVQTDAVVAVVPAPLRATDRDQLARRLVGRGAVLGPAQPWASARTSLRLAGLAARLVESGVLHADPVWVDEHLASLLVHGDPDVVSALTTARLSPLDQVKDAARERLAATLLAWLKYRGERQRVAAALHVHPQTVAYRMGQLRTLFGAALEDPQGRFELELALRATGPSG